MTDTNGLPASLARLPWWQTAFDAARGRAAAASLVDAVRQAVGLIDSWDLPTGIKFMEPDAPGGHPAWIFALPVKLESPNATMGRRWFMKNKQRVAFETMLWAAVAKIERVGSQRGLLELKRAPACTVPMREQIVRLVPSSREFIRDSVDNLVFCGKHLRDSLVRVKVIYSDRTAWLSGNPVIQAVSPTGRPVTVVILWPDPTVAALPLGPEGPTPDVCHPSHPDAPGDDHAPAGDGRAGDSQPRRRRRAHARAADPGARAGD